MSSKPRDTDKFLATMRKRFAMAEEALTDLHREALEDFKFRAGGEGQWDSAVLAQRKADGRPCYTINRIPEFVRQITGVQKKNRPAIEVSPIGDGASLETAEIIQGVCRHIERLSSADEAYDTAFDHMATGGFGFFRLVTEYVGDSMDQEISIVREANPFAHYPDPRAKKLDYSDARFWFVIDDMPQEDFEEQYPDSTLAGLTEFGSIANSAPGWIQAGSVRVAEYFWIETSHTTIKVGGKTRQKPVKTVRWIKTNGVEILDEAIVPGEYIPIVPVLGEEIIVEGKRSLVGIVRNARVPQQLYNIWQSGMAETIALAPKAPYMVTPTQVEGFEEIWDKANSENLPYLPYNPDPKAPPPQRNYAEPPIQAITSAIAHADNDLKTTTGLYDASLGAPGPEQSGKAILLRQKQGEGATYGFIDAMTRAIKLAGKIIIGWIPVVYDSARVLRIIAPDNTSKTVPVNQPFIHDDGFERIYDLTVGSYDVAPSSGPSYDSMREEAAQSMLGLIQAQPELMQVIGDLLVSNFDWPMAKEIAERLKKMLPPQLQDTPNGQQALPPAVQQKLAQMSQMIEQLTEKLHAEVDLRESKQLELASRERIAAMQTKAQVLQTLATIDSKEAIKLLDVDLAQLDAAQQQPQAQPQQQMPEAA